MPRSSPAVFLGLHWFTTWILLVEIVRLTATNNFLWLLEYPIPTDGKSLLGTLFAFFAALLVTRPRWAQLAISAFVPLTLALGMACNILFIKSLVWWIIFTCGLICWAAWLAHIAICDRRPILMALSVLLHLLLIAFIYIDSRFFAATNAHLSFYHLWFLRFRGVFETAGVPPATFNTIANTAISYLVITSLLGFFLRDRLEAPRQTGMRIIMTAILLSVHIVQFEKIISETPLPDYLTFRMQFGSHFIPQPSRFRKTNLMAAWNNLPAVDPAALYRPGRFAWKACETNIKAKNADASELKLKTASCTNARHPNIVIFLIESWRAEFFVTFMPRLARRALQGLWLRQHYAQANSTLPSVVALFHGCMPVDYIFNYHRLKEVAFFEFLRRSGYSCHLVQGNPPGEGIEGLNQLFEGFVIHTPSVAANDWPALTKAAIEKIPLLLETSDANASPSLIVAYLYNTHFDYRYPANSEYERFQPVLPEGTDVLSLDPTPEAVLGITNRYKNALNFLDEQLENFFNHFESSKSASNTWLVLVGDHGESLGDAGFFAHATGPHISQFHVPCLIFGPRLKPQIINNLTQHVDLLPTLAELMGIEVHGLIGKDARYGVRNAVVGFDLSADRRLIVRSLQRMSLFDLVGLGYPEWILTTRNDFSLDQQLISAYTASDASMLAAIVHQDALWLNELLTPAQQ